MVVREIVRTDPIPKPGVSYTLHPLRKGSATDVESNLGVLPTFGVDEGSRLWQFLFSRENTQEVRYFSSHRTKKNTKEKIKEDTSQCFVD